ncbi:MAG: type VI secretion system-associated protein TagF [Paracoccaceae bacterium]|nr:MAG: type VI secretion system-associated protein TagF [Paracoccaceae bacterium]
MTARFGAFGKFPALGDFFRLDLPQGFVDPWDRWLQDGIVAARSTLGEAWQDCYFSAPIWRFTLAPGIAGASGWIGVMMMSVDRVGRQFPLTLVAGLADEQPAMLEHFRQQSTFLELEHLALDALEDGMTREVLSGRLAAIALDPPGAPVRLAIAPGGLTMQGASPGQAGAAVAAQLAGARFRRPSVWSADLDGATRLMVCEGLPAGGQMLGLFDMGAQVWQAPEEAA